MVEVPVDTRVWLERLVPGAPVSLEARALSAQLPAETWTQHRVPGDSRGPEHANFAIRWVVASRDGPGGAAAVSVPGLGLGVQPCGAAPTDRGAGGHALPHQAAAGPGDAGRPGGRGLAAAALGDLR